MVWPAGRSLLAARCSTFLSFSACTDAAYCTPDHNWMASAPRQTAALHLHERHHMLSCVAPLPTFTSRQDLMRRRHLPAVSPKSSVAGCSPAHPPPWCCASPSICIDLQQRQVASGCGCSCHSDAATCARRAAQCRPPPTAAVEDCGSRKTLGAPRHSRRHSRLWS